MDEYDHERWLWETFYCDDCMTLYCQLPKGVKHCGYCGDAMNPDAGDGWLCIQCLLAEYQEILKGEE